jgi:hypothetical protein
MKKNILLSACMTGLFILLFVFSSKSQTVYVVTDSTDGSTPGKLRYAMEQANLNSGSSIIRFNIPATIVSNPIKLTLTNSLPPIKKKVWIDGTTQPGYSNGNPRIKILGTISWTGIKIDSAYYCKIQGLYIQQFGIGINISFANNCEVSNCIINQITSGTTLQLVSSSYCTIKSNIINTDKAGTNFSGSNATEGILITNGTVGSSYNIIGGQGCDEGNTIAYTGSEGIDNYSVNSSLNVGNRYSGNKIYGNSSFAIYLRSAANGNIQPPVITTPAGCVLSGTSTTPFGIVEVFSATTGSADQKSALQFLATTTANASGAWSVAIGISPTDRVTATITDPVTNNTSELSTGVPIISSKLKLSNFVGVTVPSKCFGSDFNFTTIDTGICVLQHLFSYGDGTPLSSNPIHSYSSQGFFNIIAYAYSQSGCASINSTNITVQVTAPCPPPCTDCIGSFSPDAGKYIISGWVKKETPSATDVSYSTPRLEVSFPSSSTGAFNSFPPSGQIIDGWQRIEGEFTVPSTGVSSIKINLKCLSGSGNCLFDDIRVFPVDGSAKSYVYDPVSMKLVAELDERNYSTFYEYDEEGKLVRVKKETEKGIMTIKENRDNTNKR